MWGKQGVGKTSVVHSVLNDLNITTNNIIFSHESFFPLGTFTYEEWMDNNKYNILMQCTQKFRNGECILFQNMEKCELDYERLILFLLQYNKNANHSQLAILEYNVETRPNNAICALANYTINVKEKDSTFFNYLNKYFLPDSKDSILFNNIVKLTNKNIETFFSVLSILQELNVISKNNKGYFNYRNKDFNLPNNIFELYTCLLNELDNKLKEPLLLSAPLSPFIYEKLLCIIFCKYNNMDNLLKNICEYESLLSYNTNGFYINADLFQTSYVFSTEEARRAVLTKLDDTLIHKNISEYCNYFDKIYCNKEQYNHLRDIDKFILLCSLTKMRKNNFTFNQIKYIVDLMEYYYKHFMYLNAIEHGKKLIESNLLSAEQINIEAHYFWIIYFKSLLAVGDYQNIIQYKKHFEDSDLNYCIALALYYNGSPLESLQILNTRVEGDKANLGYKYNLMAAIFDWIGNKKKSEKYFSLALKYAFNNLELKYQLYKKYSLYIDFRIPECQKKMEQATQYYKKHELKQYAECLHNFGTGCIFILDFENAKNKLNQSIDVLDKVCSNEIYYPLNSMAILNCYHLRNYFNAIKLWAQALEYDVHVDFCKMAIHNNIFNIYIKIERYDLAEQQKKLLKKMFLSRCGSFDKIKKEKPDIQHQLRQYYYNCGLLLKAKHCDSEALNMFIKAKKCSTYHSVILYSINCYIEEIKKKLKKNNSLLLINNIIPPKPTPIEKFIYDKQMYLCEIMFWG